MTYDEAKWWKMVYWFIGCVIAAVCGIVAIISALNSVYAAAASLSDNIFAGGLSRLIMYLVEMAYYYTQFLDPVWRYGPVIDTQELFAASTVLYALLCLGIWVGLAIFRMGSDIAAEIQYVKGMIRRRQLQESISPRSTGSVSEVRLSLDMPPIPQPSIWLALWRTIIVPVIVAVITAVVLLLLGLS